MMSSPPAKAFADTLEPAVSAAATPAELVLRKLRRFPADASLFVSLSFIVSPLESPA